MHTIADARIPVQRPYIRHAALYAKALLTYVATWQAPHGTTIEGTARELYAPGSTALEFRATHYAERRIVRRSDSRLTLGAEVPRGPLA